MKKILLIILLLTNTACSFISFFSWGNYNFSKFSESKREEKIIEITSKLDVEYYKLLENEIRESERNNLEKKYSHLETEILKIPNINTSKNHSTFLNKYLKSISLKLQYLRDLK